MCLDMAYGCLRADQNCMSRTVGLTESPGTIAACMHRRQPSQTSENCTHDCRVVLVIVGHSDCASSAWLDCKRRYLTFESPQVHTFFEKSDSSYCEPYCDIGRKECHRRDDVGDEKRNGHTSLKRWRRHDSHVINISSSQSPHPPSCHNGLLLFRTRRDIHVCRWST